MVIGRKRLDRRQGYPNFLMHAQNFLPLAGPQTDEELSGEGSKLWEASNGGFACGKKCLLLDATVKILYVHLWITQEKKETHYDRYF